MPSQRLPGFPSTAVELIGQQGWTLSTLAVHFHQKIEDMEKRVIERFALAKDSQDAALTATEKAISAAMAASEKAISKAEVSAEKRFDSVNEFRNTLKDQQGTFADKAQMDFRLGSIEKKIENWAGQIAGVGSVWAYVVGAIGAVFGLVGVFGFFLKFFKDG